MVTYSPQKNATLSHTENQPLNFRPTSPAVRKRYTGCTLIQTPVLARRLTRLGLKDLGEVRGVFKPKLISDLADRIFRAPQERLGLFDEFEVDMFHGALAGKLLQEIGKIVGPGDAAPRQIGHRR